MLTHAASRFLTSSFAVFFIVFWSTAGLSPISIRHKGGNVPDEKTPKPAASLGCAVVPAEKGGCGVEAPFEGKPEEGEMAQATDSNVWEAEI